MAARFEPPKAFSAEVDAGSAQEKRDQSKTSAQSDSVKSDRALEVTLPASLSCCARCC